MDAADSQATIVDEELDADQIANMINMSMQHASDLVASWMLPPDDPAALKPLPKVDQREFEKFVMRPPRYAYVKGILYGMGLISHLAGLALALWLRQLPPIKTPQNYGTSSQGTSGTEK